MRDWEAKFKIQKDNWTFTGAIVEQDDIGDYNRAKEIELVEKCHKWISEVFSKPNRFEKIIAKMENIPITDPATKKLHSFVVFTTNNHYFCVGSGGIGGGKTFWTPYTAKDEKVRDKILTTDICDNCQTMAHELQHGIGSHTEFDDFSFLPAVYLTFENFKLGERKGIEKEVGYRFLDAKRAVEKKQAGKRLKHFEKKGLAFVCAINERFPKKLREVLREREYKDSDIEKVLDYCNILS